jgi:hypothetical protein
MSDDRTFELGVRDKQGNTTTFDATIHYQNANKPCAFVLNESPNNKGAKLSDVSDKAMLVTANAVMKTHEKQMNGGDKLYAFAENGKENYKQQPFEMRVEGTKQDQSAEKKFMSPYSKDTQTDHKPLDSIHKDRMKLTISDLQGKNILAENNMPSQKR